MKRATVLLAPLLFLAGCAPEGGTVTRSYRNSDGKNWTICAELDDEIGCNVMISVSDGPRCSVGERYPDCLKSHTRRSTAMSNRATSANVDLNNKTYSTGRSATSELSESDKRALERKSLTALARRAR